VCLFISLSLSPVVNRQSNVQISMYSFAYLSATSATPGGVLYADGDVRDVQMGGGPAFLHDRGILSTHIGHTYVNIWVVSQVP